jgi:galactose mutarotase-like enzyme
MSISGLKMTETEQESELPYTDELICLQRNGQRLLVNPERGGDVLSFRDASVGGGELLWVSRQARLRQPQAGPLRADIASFYDEYPGGIQELFPNTADSANVSGAELPFHGEACRVRWNVVARGPADELSVALATRLRRFPVDMRKTLSLASGGGLNIQSRVENVSRRSIPYSWAFHPAFGEALLDGGCTLYVPAQEVSVHPEPFSDRQRWAAGTNHPLNVRNGVGEMDLRRPDNPGADLLYVACKEGWFIARNHRTGLTVTATWDVAVMPFLWVWQECHDPAGYPWWGLEDVVGLEPHSHVPARDLSSHVDAGEACWLEPNGSAEAHLKLNVTLSELSTRPIGVDVQGLAIFERST